jgi:hypothetical protein
MISNLICSITYSSERRLRAQVFGADKVLNPTNVHEAGNVFRSGNVFDLGDVLSRPAVKLWRLGSPIGVLNHCVIDISEYHTISDKRRLRRRRGCGRGLEGGGWYCRNY